MVQSRFMLMLEKENEIRVIQQDIIDQLQKLLTEMENEI